MLVCTIQNNRYHWLGLPSCWYVDLETKRLYHCNGALWQVHTQIPRHTWGLQFHNPGTNTDQLPGKQQWERVTVQITQQTILITGSAPQQNQLQMTPSQQLGILEMPYAQACQLVIHKDPETETLIQAMEQELALAVSDRSFSQDMGAAVWMIEGAMEIGQWIASCLALGQWGDHSAFQSKLAKIYGICFMVKHLLADYNGLTGKLTIACDGKSAVDRLNLKTNSTDRSTQWSTRSH